MGELSMWQAVKAWIGSLAWRVFIWANDTTEEKYWQEIARDFYENDREQIGPWT